MATSPNDHNIGSFVTENQQRVEGFYDEYKAEWPKFCKLLGIHPTVLQRVEPQVVIAVMLLRMHKMYVSKLQGHEAALNTAAGAMEALSKVVTSINEELKIVNPKH